MKKSKVANGERVPYRKTTIYQIKRHFATVNIFRFNITLNMVRIINGSSTTIHS